MEKLIKELAKIQKELKAPKNQYNKSGDYRYRNLEDILEAVKPLMPENISLILSDEMICIGARYYNVATARFTDGVNEIKAKASAREAQFKQGMDEAQITGACSSYARKYALNALFLIDDTKDADSVDNSKIDRLKELKAECEKIDNIEDLKKFYNANKGCGAEFDKQVADKKAELIKLV